MNEPASGIRRVAFKIKSKGPGWIVRRLAAEASQPTTPPGRLLHRLARNATTLAAALPRCLHALAVPKPAEAARTLFAFYDLQVSPITFDFLWFLVGADLERRRRGLDAVHVMIVPGRAGGCAASARTMRMSSTPRHGPSASAICCCRPVRCADLHRRHPCRIARACRLHPRDLGEATSIQPPTRRRCRSLPARANALQKRWARTCPTYPACERPMRTCATSTDGRRAARAGFGSSPSRCATTLTCRRVDSSMQAWTAFCGRSHPASLYAGVCS